MKKILLIIISLLTFIPCVVFANEYNTVKLSAVFSTSADTSKVNKIIVHYNTYKDGVKVENTQQLLLVNQYQLVMNVDAINDIEYLYATCVTAEGNYDSFGFVTPQATKVANDEEGYLELVINLLFNDMGFDGNRYRKNSDITDDMIDERKEGVPVNNSKQKTTIKTTTPDANLTTTAPDIVRTTTVINGNDDYSKKEEEKQQQSYLLLEIIIGVGIGIIIIVGIVIAFKMREVKKKV